MDKADVKVLDAKGNVLAGPVTTTSEGAFSLNVAISDLTGDFIIESTGGEFTDEATGKARNAAGKLSAYVTSGSKGSDSSIVLTPASSILCILRKGGKNAAEADSIFNKSFGFIPDLSVKPVDVSTPPNSLPEEQRLAGLRTAAFSQLTQDLGLDPAGQFALIEALARDLADNRLDGKDSSGSIELPGGKSLAEDIQNRFERSLLKIMAGKKTNLELTPDKIGILPFGKVALTDDYRVEYVEGMMPAKPGRTEFRIKVTDLKTGGPAKGLAMKLMPIMYMATHEHSTPIGGITDNGDGTYSCEVFYLMASMMKDKSMGYWELEVATGSDGKPVYFHPSVMMGMGGDSVRATLRGVSDKTAGMGTNMAASRTYILFNNGLSGSAGEYRFDLFISTKENMMNFPAVSSGMLLKNEMDQAWKIDSMSVAVSTDGVNWVGATENEGGKWSASGLAGLNKDVAATIRVKLVINGEQKTVDGLPLSEDGGNGYAVFSLKPRN